MSETARISLLVLCSLAAFGCGAKTGLEVPDASFDAGIDAGTDAGTDSGIPCVDIPLDGGTLEVPLDIQAELVRADVLFLVDTTASMGEEIEQVRAGLRDRIAPGIAAQIPDSAFGVAHHDDFPVPMCGDSGDTPFEQLLQISDDLNAVQAALDSLDLGNGLDRPESQIEALYQVATGEGLGSFIAPSFGCPSGGFGYPCFRDDALPVVLLFTDAPFHNGPSGSEPISAACGTVSGAHTYEEAVAALQSLGIRVMGMYSASDTAGLPDLEQLAIDTGAVDEGQPIVFNIGPTGASLSASVIEAIRTLADVIEFDVDTMLVDPDLTDDIDPRDFVDAVVPIRAEPMDRVQGIDLDSGSFLGVRAGTRVFFELHIRAGAVVPGTEPRHVLLEIVFRGDRRTRLGSRLVDLVIPGADGSGCGAL